MLNTTSNSVQHQGITGIQQPQQMESAAVKPEGPKNTQTTSSYGQMPAFAYKAQFAGNIRFGHKLTQNDYVVAHGASVPINSDTSAKTLTALMQNALFKLSQMDPTNLKYNLQAHEGYMKDMTAAGDNMILVGRPVDTVIQSAVGRASNFPLQMSRLTSPESRLYMGKDATIKLGPAKGIGYGTNHDWQLTREHTNETIRDLEALLQLTTGKKDRAEIYKDITGAKEFNPLEALHYGEKGLVDAVLVGEDKVLSRAKLDEFYQSKGWNADQIAEFNHQSDSLDEIPEEFLTPLAEFSPASVAPEVTVAPLSRSSYQPVSMPKQFLLFKRGLNSSGFTSVQADKASPKERISLAPDFTAQTEYWLGGLNDVPNLLGLLGILYDDAILFHTNFTEFSADQVTQAIHTLSDKKQQQKANGEEPSNIKILVNSPGGVVDSADEIRSAISQQSVPVDVIVQGWAASCGAYLLASATGKRYATPNARVMIHQPRTSEGAVFRENLQEANDYADGIQATSEKLTKVISKASGRKEKDVWQDMKQDTFLNPLEAMFYGSKGLLDGVLVASDKAVTRADVLEYLETDPQVQEFLQKKFGKDDAKENVKAYLDARLDSLQEPNRVHELKQWEQVYGQDPFSNPFLTLMKLAEKAKPLSEIPELKASASRPQPTFEHFNVGLSDDNLASLLPFLPSEEARQKAAAAKR